MFQEGSALGMRLDNMERECRAFGERVDMNITSMGNFEVEPRTSMEQEFKKTQDGVNLADRKAEDVSKRVDEAKKTIEGLIGELNKKWTDLEGRVTAAAAATTTTNGLLGGATAAGDMEKRIKDIEMYILNWNNTVGINNGGASSGDLKPKERPILENNSILSIKA